MKFIKFYALLSILIVSTISCDKEETITKEKILDTTTTKDPSRISGVIQLNPNLQNNTILQPLTSFDSPMATSNTSTTGECDAMVKIKINFSHRNCDEQSLITSLSNEIARELPRNLDGVTGARLEADGIRIYGQKMRLKSYFLLAGGKTALRKAVEDILNRTLNTCIVGQIYVESITLFDTSSNSCFNSEPERTNTPEQDKWNQETNSSLNELTSVSNETYSGTDPNFIKGNKKGVSSLKLPIVYSGYTVSFSWNIQSVPITLTDLKADVRGFTLGILSFSQLSQGATNIENASNLKFTITGNVDYSLFIEGIGRLYSQPVTINGTYNATTGKYTLTQILN